MGRWISVAKVEDFEDLPADQKSLEVDVEGYEMVIFQLSDGWGALDNTCSHEYSKLSDGEVWNDRVYCAKHGSSFDCTTGEVKGLPAIDDVQAFKAKQHDNEIWVELPDYS